MLVAVAWTVVVLARVRVSSSTQAARRSAYCAGKGGAA
jgi:hypothetical protein